MSCDLGPLLNSWYNCNMKDDYPKSAELVELKRKRIEHERKLQDDYDRMDSYSARIKFIVELLERSQGKYLDFKNNPLFSPQSLRMIYDRFAELPKVDEAVFIQFLRQNLTKKIESWHVRIDDECKDLENKNQRVFVGSLENSNVNVRVMDDTVLVKVKSFFEEHMEKDKHIFDNMRQMFKTKPIRNIVIDIRGNTGGSDWYYRLFSIFTKHDVKTTKRWFNLFSGKLEEYTNIDILGEPEASDYKRCLLVDSKTFSAADEFARVVKSSGFATIIGEKTSGEGYGLSPYYLRLDNDHELVFTVEAPVNQSGQIDYEHFYATEPDIICSGEQALDQALRYLADIK